MESRELVVRHEKSEMEGGVDVGGKWVRVKRRENQNK